MRPITSLLGANAFEVRSSGEELMTALARKTFLELTEPMAKVSTLMLEYTKSELSVICS